MSVWLSQFPAEMQMDQPVKVLHDGFVRLVDGMGDDAAVVQAARVSYQAGTKTPSEDSALIDYLMRHDHTTPLEMVEFKFHIRVPMDIWRQWIRHRTASVNEYSTRYSIAIDSQHTTLPGEWRLQSEVNKQGSDGGLTAWPDGWTVNFVQGYWHAIPPGQAAGYPIRGLPPDVPPTPGQLLTSEEENAHFKSKWAYDLRLALGVAREQARKDLPLSTYTEAYWKIDLHNLMHFLRLRLDSHAQLEIRQYAAALAGFVKKACPMVWAAFERHRLNSMRLSSTEIELIRNMIQNGRLCVPGPDDSTLPSCMLGARNRLRDEAMTKLRRLGFGDSPRSEQPGAVQAMVSDLLSVLAYAVSKGMPVTEQVANARNAAVQFLARPAAHYIATNDPGCHADGTTPPSDASE